jgi:prefoldin subunit 5
MPQGIAAMQQQIAALERELAAVQESLDAVANLSQALSRDLSSAGKRLPSLDRVPTGLGKFRLILRP